MLTFLSSGTGIMNVLQGSDYEVKLLKNMTEEEVENLSCKGGSSDDNGEGSHKAPTPYRSTARTAPLPYTKSNKNTKGCSDDPKKSCNSSGPVAYALLKDVRDVNSLPSQVDPFRREQALSNREFEQVFGIKKEQFATLPAWRKASMKKAKGLF